MKNKKKSSKRKEESESSSSSSSSSDSDGESSGSSSDSSRSPARKKSKAAAAGKHSKRRSPSSDNEAKGSKAKPVKDVHEERLRIDRKEIEHSKWDSPVERTDKKKKPEPRRDSESRERENKRERERKDDRHADRQEPSKDRERRPERAYNKRYDDRDNRGRNRDYRNEERDRDRNNDRDRERNDRDRNERDRERNERDRDRREERYPRGGDRKRSPQRDQRNTRRNRSRSASFDHSKAKWGREEPGQQDKKDSKANSNAKDKEKPNFGLSGKLTEETNTYKGVVIKYSEPPEARKPRRRWRLYPFKGEKAMQTLYIHRESAYLIGRDRKVVDLPVDHPSCSKQHAALQYRLVPFTRDDGSVGKRVRPYLIDLDSANGTYINNKKIDSKKYIELLEKDVIKFGFSSREYVLLHENSKDEKMDDDVKPEEEEQEVAVKRERED